jgi:hypothetical protein
MKSNGTAQLGLYLEHAEVAQPADLVGTSTTLILLLTRWLIREAQGDWNPDHETSDFAVDSQAVGPLRDGVVRR